MVLNGPYDNLLCSYKHYTFAQKSSKNKGMIFDFFGKKHITEALSKQGNPHKKCHKDIDARWTKKGEIHSTAIRTTQRCAVRLN